jgi:pilus assembly protein FimV
MRPLARWGSLLLLATPFGAWALGLGEIELHSALNQPLNAEIELVSATPAELADLAVAMAPAASFERYGLERPAFLNSFEFELGRNAAGADIIHVTSTASITEPFVTMLVVAEWARRRSLREYTVFLDPPILLPAPAAPQPIAPAQTRTPQPSVGGGSISRPAANPQPAPAPSPVQQAPRPAPVTSGNATDSSYGPVQASETLWGITSRLRPNEVSVNQMMIAVYQANPDAFVGNINRLRRGAILRIPPVAELAALSAANATDEVRRQNEAWQGASAATPEPRLVLVPPSDAPVDSAEPRGASANAASNGEITALQNQVSALEAELQDNERILELRNSELAALQSRLSAGNVAPAAIEAPVAAAADPGRELESEQLFADEDAIEDGAEDASADSAAAAPEAEPVQAAAPAPIVAPPSTATANSRSPSIVDQIIGIVTSQAVLIGGGVLLVLIAGLMFLRRRKDEVEDVTGQWEALEAELDEEDEDIAATARIRAQAKRDGDIVVVEGPRDAGRPAGGQVAAAAAVSSVGDGTAEIEAISMEPVAEQTLSSQTVINLDQADPIAEADFHMAYGLYDQAADLVSKALEGDPDNRDYKIKLLEVFFVWGNKDSFLATARDLHNLPGTDASSDWAKVIIMGKQICPEDALFADAHAAAGDVDLNLDAGESPGLDMTFDAADDGVVDFDFGGLPDEEISLEGAPQLGDTGGFNFTDELPSTDNALADSEMLDIGARTQAGLEAALFDMDAIGEATSPDLDVDDLEATQESPTVETASSMLDGDDSDWAGATMESPTIETVGTEAATVESPSLLDGGEPTVETPTLETAAPSASDGFNATSDSTAELDLDDLGLRFSDIEGLAADLGDLQGPEDSLGDTREQPALDADEDLLTATGVTQVLSAADIDDVDSLTPGDATLEFMNTSILSDDEATIMTHGFDAKSNTATEVLSQPDGLAQHDDSDSSMILDIGDFSEALKGSDTIEQPGMSNFDASIFDGDSGGTPVDLDVGFNPVYEDEPTGTEEVGPLDAQTMTEVGTKLDLARAYIDMGDPEGAKSILEEVLTEGDSGQREEARSLISALPA